MRFLCDENVQRAVATALEAAGHDVTRVSDLHPRMRDPDVLDLARRERRILVTHDKDFGELVFLRGHLATGVILLRLSTGRPGEIARTLVSLVGRLGDRLKGAFATVGDSRVRLRKMV